MKQTMVHQVDMKNFFKYWKYFLWYSNTRVHSRKYCLGFLYETLFVFVIIPIVYEDPLEWFFLPDHCDPLRRFGILLFSRDTNGDARNLLYTFHFYLFPVLDPRHNFHWLIYSTTKIRLQEYFFSLAYLNFSIFKVSNSNF